MNTGEWRLARLLAYSELSFWFALGPWERSSFSIVFIFNMTCAFPSFFAESTSPEHLFYYYFKGSTITVFIFFLPFYFSLVFIIYFLKLFYWNILNLQRISTLQQMIVMHVPTFFFIFFSIVVCHRILNIVACAIR